MSWLSSALHTVGSYVAGDGNPAGNPSTRELGYDPQEVAKASAVILNQPAPLNVQHELLFLGLAGVGLILLLRPKR